MRIALVTATYPPIACGIGDYTFHLSAELARTNDVTVVTTRHVDVRPPSGVAVARSFDGREPKSVFGIVSELERLAPDWIVVQYDPYSYGTRHAFNPYLPGALALVRRKLPKTRIAVVIHETFAEPTSFKRAVMTTWQRAQLLSLLRTAHLGVFVVEAWARRFARWAPRLRVVHIPVGNNIPRVAVNRETLRRELDVPADAFVVGWLGRTQPTLNAEWILDALRGVERADRELFVVHVGVGAHDAAAVLQGVPAKIASVLPASDISRHLSSLDLYVAPMSEGVSTRRTSVVAALSHALPVVASSGPMTDSIFHRENERALLLVDPSRGERFADAVARLVRSPELRGELAQGAESLVTRAFSWPAIASQVIDALNATA